MPPYVSIKERTMTHRLQARREQSGMSVEELSRNTHVPASTIETIERSNGTYRIDQRVADALAVGVGGESWRALFRSNEISAVEKVIRRRPEEKLAKVCSRCHLVMAAKNHAVDCTAA